MSETYWDRRRRERKERIEDNQIDYTAMGNAMAKDYKELRE